VAARAVLAARGGGEGFAVRAIWHFDGVFMCI